MNLTTETKLFAGIIVATVVIISGALFFFTGQEKNQKEEEQKVYSREELITATTNTLGNASAAAYLVEFSDFKCPACKLFEPVLKDIMKNNSDKLLFAYRHFPLNIPDHAYAPKAAIAAEAAGRQGKFWEMHDKIFENQDSLSDDVVNTLAQELSLDIEQFQKDLADPTIKGIVDADIAYGNSININSTPTFFLNGKKMTYKNAQEFISAIEEAVK